MLDKLFDFAYSLYNCYDNNIYKKLLIKRTAFLILAFYLLWIVLIKDREMKLILNLKQHYLVMMFIIKYSKELEELIDNEKEVSHNIVK